jgi:hypothetical protein
MRVLERDGCWRVLEREGWWECWREGGVMRVLERERPSCKEFGSLPDKERFASFTFQAATPQTRVSRSNRIGNTTGRNMQNGPVVPQTALSRPQIHSCFAKFGPRDPYSSNMFSSANFSKRRRGR